MHRAWIDGVDSGIPVRKLFRHHVAYVAREGILLWIQTELPVHALCLDWSRISVDSGVPVRKLTRYHFGWSEETLGLGALAAISMILRSGS